MEKRECRVLLDRLVIAAESRNPQTPPQIPGFKIVKNFRPFRKGKITSYERVCKYKSITGSAQIILQYKRLVPWVRPWRFTLIADDATGITPEEIAAVVMNCTTHIVTMVELAIDFKLPSEVDRDFVLRHGRFGKSHRRPKIGGTDYLRYGTRASAKLVRCYFKPEVNCYRVELECHAALLKSIGVSRATDLPKLGQRLCHGHCRFINVNEAQLKQHLIKKFGRTDALRILDVAAGRYTSLQRVTRFLTDRGVWNVNRFLRPRAINSEIQRALNSWAGQFTPEALDPEVGDA